MVVEGTTTPAYAGSLAAVTAREPRFVVAQSPREAMNTPSSAQEATLEVCPRPIPLTPKTTRGLKPIRRRGR